MAHKRDKRTTPSEKPVSKKLLPPPSSPPPSENEEQQLHHETPQPLHAQSPNKSKKTKKKNTENQNEEVEEPRVVVPPLRIIWKVEDETELLKCMAAFIASTGLDPYKEAEAFRSFAKESEYSLPEASIYQLKEKIRRMKRKFAEGSGGPKFTELARNVWEPEKKNTKGKESESRFEDPEQEQHVQNHKKRSSKRVLFAEPEREHEDDDSKGVVGNWRAEWEKKWEELEMAQLELYVNKAELIRDQARLMLEASRSSN